MTSILKALVLTLVLAGLPGTAGAEDSGETGGSEEKGNSEEPGEPGAAEAAMKELSPRVGQEALKFLGKARTAQDEGQLDHARALAQQALRIAPRLGAAHSVLADMLFAARELEPAAREYRIAVSLVEHPAQPLLRNSFWGPQAKDPTELAADTYVQFGLCLVELAKVADGKGESEREQVLLRKARDAFNAGLSRKPRAELRKQAKQMLKRFNR